MSTVDILQNIGLIAIVFAGVIAVISLLIRVGDQQMDIDSLREDRDKLVRRAIKDDLKKAEEQYRRERQS